MAEKIFLLILFAILGAATYFALIIFRPFPTITTPIIQTVQTISDNLTGHFQTYLTNPAVVTAASSMGVALLVNYIRAKMQQRIENKARAEIENLQTEIARLHNMKNQLEYEKTQLQQKLAEAPTTTLQQQVIELQQQLLEKEKEIERLIYERNEAERLFRQKYFPEQEQKKVE